MEIIERRKINPIPRGANYMCWDTFRMGPDYRYAHQLIYIFSGTGIGRLNEEEFRLEPGMFVTYSPGTLHEFRSDPGVRLTTATMCFSWCDVGDRRLELANRGVQTLTPEYWKLCDDPVQLEGLPPFPIRLMLEEPQRRVMEPLFREIGSMWRKEPYAPLAVLKAKAVLSELVFQLEKQLAAKEPEEPPALIRFRRFVEQHYASDIVRRDAAVAVGVSESHLTSLLIRHLGSNFSEYLNRIRLKAAAELLQYSTMSVKEVSAAVGFRSSSYFIARFHERYGVSPSHARNGV